MNASNWRPDLSQVSEVAHQRKHHSVKTRQISRCTKDVMGRGSKSSVQAGTLLIPKAGGTGRSTEKTKRDDIAEVSKEDFTNSMEEHVLYQEALKRLKQGHCKKGVTYEDIILVVLCRGLIGNRVLRPGRKVL